MTVSSTLAELQETVVWQLLCMLRFVSSLVYQQPEVYIVNYNNPSNLVIILCFEAELDAFFQTLAKLGQPVL